MKLLLATYNYPPEAYGGSEVYLERLAAELVRAGHEVEILCGSREPARGPERLEIEEDSRAGLKVWRIRISSGFTMPELWTTRAAGLRGFWKEWLARHRPAVLHFYGHSLAIFHSLMEAGADLNISMVFTLHNVPTLCPRGDYLTWRGPVCDGRVELLKCVRCTTSTRAGGLAGTAMAALTPLLFHLPVPESTGWSRGKSALHYPGLLRMRLQAQDEMLGIVRRWHVFSEWSRQALELNGVPQRKNCAGPASPPGDGWPGPATSPAGSGPANRILGRCHKVKGVPVLLEVMRMVPDAPLRLEIFGSAPDGTESPHRRTGGSCGGARSTHRVARQNSPRPATRGAGRAGCGGGSFPVCGNRTAHGVRSFLRRTSGRRLGFKRDQ